MKALHTAASGMRAQEMNVEVVANNIANMRTTGYKRQRAEFQDLLYENQRRAGSATSDTGTVVPTGIQIGSGVKFAATSRVLSQGDLEITEKELNIGIRGEGYFPIQLPDGRTAYTRDGSFELDDNGTMVTLDGYQVGSGITVPQNARSLSISQDGTVEAVVGTSTTPTNLGTLQIARFVNQGGLESIGDNLLLETTASGTAVTGAANNNSYGALLQGYLESSNVEAVAEISELIAAQRAYELNSRVISAADEMMSSTAALTR